MKPVRLSAHALSYTTKRGFTSDEVEKAIQDSSWEPAELRRPTRGLPYAGSSLQLEPPSLIHPPV